MTGQEPTGPPCRICGGPTVAAYGEIEPQGTRPGQSMRRRGPRTSWWHCTNPACGHDDKRMGAPRPPTRREQRIQEMTRKLVELEGVEQQRAQAIATEAVDSPSTDRGSTETDLRRLIDGDG